MEATGRCEAGFEFGIADGDLLELLPVSAAVQQDPVRQIESEALDALVQILPDHVGEAEQQKRLRAVSFEELTEAGLVEVHLFIERVEMIASEVREAQHAGGAGVEALAVGDQRRSFDHDHRKAAGAEDVTENASEGIRLAHRRFLVDEDLAHLLAGGAARSHRLEDGASRRYAREAMALENSDGQETEFHRVIARGRWLR